MVRRPITLLLVLLLLVLFSPTPALAQGSHPRDTIAGVIARQQSLANLVVEYEKVTSFTPKVHEANAGAPNASVNDNVQMVVTKGTATSKCSFRYLGGKVRYESEIVHADGTAQSLLTRQIEAFSPERVEMLWRQRHETWDHGFIDINSRLPNDVILDYMLGLRGYNNDEWLRADDWKQFVTRESGNRIEIQRRRHVSDPKGIIDVWVVDSEKGNALVEYQVLYKGRVSLAGTATDLRETSGITLPYAINWVQYGPDGPDAGAVETTELRIGNYQINSGSNTSDRFLLEWPKNTIVSDRRNGTVIHVKDRPRVLDDTYLQSLARGETALARTQRTTTIRWFLWLQLAVIAVIISVFLNRYRKRQGLDRQEP